MSTQTVYKYRVYCVEDANYEYVWGTSPPLKCPDNTAHTLDLSQTTIVDQIDQNVVEIKESSLITGGNFRCDTIRIDAPANSTTIVPRVYPFPIDALAVKCISGEIHRGDNFSLSVGRNTITGAITAALTPASAWASQNYVAGDRVVFGGKYYTCITDTTTAQSPLSPTTGQIQATYWRLGYRVPVQATVLAYANVGYEFNLFVAPTTTESLGRCVGVDTTNNWLYVETGPSESYSPLTPTYVRQTVYSVKNYEFSEPASHFIGEGKIGGSGIPAGVAVEGHYVNTSNVDKVFIGIVEYLY